MDEEQDYQKNHDQYWNGNKNKFIRLFFYIIKGADLVNIFKYVGAFIISIYVMLKLVGIVWLLILSGISVIVLFILGWLNVWHLAKVIDWLNISLGTHWSKYGYQMSEKQIKLLEEIVTELRRK